ncbi:MAG TPA: tetratricopeptide repeat protein [Vicinamibacterales bacterium]|nr:tetratricopeptide repeat protein [Vicinamibacterales bacterium]
MKRHSLVLVAGLFLAASSGGAAQQSSESDAVTPRIRRLEQWFSAIASHRPGAVDEQVRLVNTWNQEQLRQIWIDVSTIVSLVREPDVSLFYVNEPSTRSGPGQQGQLSSLATSRSTQVLYTVGELRRIRALVKRVSPTGQPGPENDIVKRGALLHADIALLTPVASRGVGSDVRPGPGGLTLFMNDGQPIRLQGLVSHWNMGRRLLDRVRPLNTRSGLKTASDPAADDFVRRWYLAVGAYMTLIRNIETSHFTRALELFPKDPDVLFFAASAHESFAGARMQSVMRSLKVPRDVSFDVGNEDSELRLAEHLYTRVLERNPTFLEARIRLGRVLGLRRHHQEAIEQLRQGVSATEPVLQYYAHLFLGREFEMLGNGPEARQSYERATKLAPMAQSPLFGLSRLAEQRGDRVAARDAVARMLALPPNEFERSDPWWVYEVVQARAVDAMLADLRQGVAKLPE